MNSRRRPLPRHRGIQNGEELLERQMTPEASGFRQPYLFEGPERMVRFGGGTSPLKTRETIQLHDHGKYAVWSGDGYLVKGDAPSAAWTHVTVPFKQPFVGASVTVSVDDSRWISPGAPIRIGAATYVVQQVNSRTSITLMRLATDTGQVRQFDTGGQWDTNLGWDVKDG